MSGFKLDTKEVDLNLYLNSKAQSLCKNIIKSTLYSVKDPNNNIIGVVPCLYFPTYLPNNKVEQKYIRAWAKMLNWLTDNNIWNYGVLAACSTIELGANAGLVGIFGIPATPARTVIYSFIFADNDFIVKNPDYNRKINEMMGWDISMLEGEIPKELTDKQIQEYWDTCPFMEKTDLSKYPHKCPRCQSPAYLGFNQVDCSAKCFG